jgi:hypothetical protein
MVIVLLLTTVAASTAASHRESSASDSIPDGWYQANVRYTTSEQDRPTSFTTSVFVKSNRVVLIDLGEQRSVQAGRTDVDYTYRGGKLSFEDNWSTNMVVAASTVVTVTRADGVVLRFDISLQARPKPQR